MSHKDALLLAVTGLVLIGVSIYGMWDYLPEAFHGSRTWQNRDTLFWKIPFFSGFAALFFSAKALYKNQKNNKNT